MKALVLGAGKVGSSLALRLLQEDIGVTLVDDNYDRLLRLQQQLDIQIVHGWPSHPAVLEQAAGDSTDLLIAVTDNDEINLVACQIAESVLKIPKCIGRVRENYYNYRSTMFGDSSNRYTLISPEREVSQYLRSMIEYPNAETVVDFVHGRVKLATTRAYKNGPLVGNRLCAAREHIPEADARVVAIYRNEQVIIPDGDTIIQEDDQVFFIASRKNLRAVMNEFRRSKGHYKRVTLVGGGNIGFDLAYSLEKHFQIKIIERDVERCNMLAAKLKSSLVLNGDGTDLQLLTRENIASSDVFCAMTDNDESNLLACVLAKQLGARKTIVLINNPAYISLIEKKVMDIDLYLSPQYITLSSLLSHIRKGDVVRAHTLRQGNAEAMEIIVHGKEENSRVVGRPVQDIPFPYGTTIGAIVRGDDVITAHHDTVVMEYDHVILFMTNKEALPQVEQLFKEE